MAGAKHIRVGIVGAGANTRDRHIPGFQQVPGVEVAAVCNRSEESSRKVAEQFGIPRIFGHWTELVESPEINAVCVGTWPYLHADVTIAALNAGKHVLTEARMARNAREAQAMVDAAAGNPRLVAQVVPSPFTLDYDETVVRLLREGRLGDLRQVDVVHTNGLYASSNAPLTWRQDFQLSGENMLTLGIYYEAIQRWLQEEPLSLRAMGAVFTRKRRRPDGEWETVRIPEAVTVLANYPGGCLLHAHFSGIESGRGRNEIILNGSEGTLRADLGQGKLYLSEKGQRAEEEVVIPPDQCRGWRVEADFVESIRNGAPVRLTSFQQGLRYMLFTEAVWKSWSTGGELALID